MMALTAADVQTLISQIAQFGGGISVSTTGDFNILQVTFNATTLNITLSTACAWVEILKGMAFARNNTQAVVTQQEAWDALLSIDT